MQHVVLYEPDPSGHRLVFVRYIVEAIARRVNMRATLVTAERVAATDCVVELRAKLERRFSLHIVSEPTRAQGVFRLPEKFDRQRAHFRILQTAVRELRIKGGTCHVMVPFLDDYCLYPISLGTEPFGTLRWSGVAVRPRFHLALTGAKVPKRKEDIVESWAYRRILRSRTLDTLFCIDPTFAPFLGDPRVVTAEDPADVVERVSEPGWLPVQPDAVVLLVYGHIDHRKAIDRLLELATDPRVPRSLVIALVGVQTPEMALVLAGRAACTLRAGGRLVEVPRRVSDEEEAAAFARADIVWAYYPGSYCSSGAMVRAGQMGRPLIATEEGLVGLLTLKYGSGLTAPEYDDAALLAQLVRLAGDAELRRKLGLAGEAHFGHTTGAAFGDRIVARLASTADRS